jgi:hypothetical protein
VLRTEGRVTLIDGILATAVLLGLVLNAALGWWWADPATEKFGKSSQAITDAGWTARRWRLTIELSRFEQTALISANRCQQPHDGPKPVLLTLC